MRKKLHCQIAKYNFYVYWEINNIQEKKWGENK